MPPVALAEPGFGRHGYLAAAHEAHVVGGAAGVGHYRRGGPGVGAREVPARNGRHRRPRTHRVDGRFGEFARVHHAALRSQHQEPSAEARRGQSFLQPADVARHQGFERSVDAGGGRPAVFAENRVENMGQGVWHTLQVFFKELAHADLVCGIHGGPQEGDGHRLHPFFSQLLDDPDDARLIERLVDAAVRADALGHLVGECARDVGFGKRHQEVERLHAPALAQHEDVGVALRGEEGGLRGVSRHDGVGGVSGAVDE